MTVREVAMTDQDKYTVRKENRRRSREARVGRPLVHGVLPYLGHRADPKHERRRLALLVRAARARR